MFGGRSRWSGSLVACVLLALACLFLLAACDNGSLDASATPSADPSTSETEAMGDLLTEVSRIPTTTPVPSPMGATAEDSLSIYLSAIDALIGEKEPAVIYVGPFVGEGDHLDNFNTTRPLPDGLLEALSKSDIGPHYELSPFEDAIEPLENGGAVKDNGLFITLGSIANDPEEKGAVVVRGSVYRSLIDALGNRLRFKRDSASPGGWKLLDVTQEWIQ